MNKKIRSPSASKVKLDLKNLPPPQRQAKRIELERYTTITKEIDGEKKEFVINFEDLKSGDLLGRGQFGTVKIMVHEASDTTFAVKMIDDNLMETNPDKKNTEIMDLEVPQKLGDKCPYLLKFYGALHAESYVWILTEVMDTSLDRFYTKCFSLTLPMHEFFISKLSFCVVSGLEYMRKQKLLHRDVKPSNILINYDGMIKLCDFGISGFTTNSVCTTFKGCQKYMPPEKINPDMTGSSYNVKADLWSLGISLIEIATGVHPFADAVGYLGLIKSIVDKEPPSLDPAVFSAEVCNFVKKCLQKFPDHRATCEELLDDEFIKKYENHPHDFEWIKKIIDEIKKDKIE